MFSDVTGGKAPTTIIKKLSNKARQFNKCVKKAKGHLQRLGDENDRERYTSYSSFSVRPILLTIFRPAHEMSVFIAYAESHADVSSGDRSLNFGLRSL